MTPDLRAAHAALCLAHPQWGWAINPHGVICGEREGVATCSVSPMAGGGWLATVTVWPLKDCEDGECEGVDPVRAFEQARKASGVEVVR